MVQRGNRALFNCLQVETKHQTIQGNYSKRRLLMENTHRRLLRARKRTRSSIPCLLGRNKGLSDHWCYLPTGVERGISHVAKPSASTKNPSKNFFKENSQSYCLNQNP